MEHHEKLERRITTERDALIYQELSEVKEELKTHILEEKEMWSKVLDAFPEGPERHREGHQAQIDAAKAQQKFYDELRLDLAKRGLWALITIITGLAFTGLFVKLGIWKLPF